MLFILSFIYQTILSFGLLIYNFVFHLFLLVYLSLFLSFKNAHQLLKFPHSPQPPAPSTASQPTFLLKVQKICIKFI